MRNNCNKMKIHYPPGFHEKVPFIVRWETFYSLLGLNNKLECLDTVCVFTPLTIPDMEKNYNNKSNL